MKQKLAVLLTAALCVSLSLIHICAKAAGSGTVKRLQGRLNDCELLNLDGKFPIWPALKKLPRFAGKKIGRIGAQADVYKRQWLLQYPC